VSGDGVARGYLNRVELTAERFVPNPFSEGQKMYKTGDIAMWINNNNIEHLGRLDQQLKIRGYRVELGEIEHQVTVFPPIKQAVVVARDDDEGEKQLLAYAVPDPESAYTVRQILNFEKRGIWGDHSIYETPGGMPLVCIDKNETDSMYHEIFTGKSYLKNGIMLHDGACVFDISANIGMFSLFVNQNSANAEIYAFETIQPVREVLKLNMELYGINAKVFSCEILSEQGEPHSGSSARTGGEMTGPEKKADELSTQRLSEEQAKSKSKTFTQVLKENNIETIDLLKIGVEKNKFHLLQGLSAEDWKKIRQIVLKVYNVEGSLQGIVDMLENHEYRVTVEQEKEPEDKELFHVYAVLPRQEKKTITKKKVNDHEKKLKNWYSPERLEEELRHYLGENLAYYMIPTYISFIDEIPLTPNGKIDRKALPEPSATINVKFTAPQGPTEKKLAVIWSKVLGIEEDKIGRDVSFFELGGHSLKATALIAEIHKELDLKLYLTLVFSHPTIREMAEYVMEAVKETHVSITAAEKKGYYIMSSAQERLFILQRIESESIGYNVPLAFLLEGSWDREKFENALRGMIKRHDSLRTSFILLQDEPVQKIHDNEDIHFELEYKDFSIDGDTEGDSGINTDEVNRLIKSFVRPFDLSRAPLIRAMLIKKKEETFIMSVDMHHIVTDGVSMDLFVKEFTALYAGEELPPLAFQYKDYSE
ncbi:MAG: FkbM family methyltransferase, partial [bacterium]|nr:FkbM family methyltransferase [bacterium]